MNTKLKIIFFVTILFTSFKTNSIAAETSSDSLTVEEMKAMFYQRYENGVKPKSLNEYDLLKWDTRSKDSMSLCSVVNNEVLKNPKGIKLPISEYVFYGDTLCWVKPRQSIDAKESEQLARKLQKKYGKIRVNDTLTIVPAKWMTGPIELLSSYPEEYATTYFSTRAFRRETINGVVKNNNYIAMDLGYSKLQIDADDISKGSNGYTVKGFRRISWTDSFNVPRKKIEKDRQLSYKRLFTLFGRDLNRTCPKAPKDYDYKNPKSYSLLFYFDSQRHVHVEVLLPKQLDDMDRLLLSNLQKAVESQPSKLFESHFTIDGKIFPGLYVKASYGGGWNLFDYRTLEEE